MIFKSNIYEHKKANELENFLDAGFQCISKKQEKTGVRNITYSCKMPLSCYL